MLGLLDEVKAALAEAEFVATGAGDEDVMMPPLASASFPGALDATFPVLALARGVCDAGWGIVGVTVCSDEAVVAFVRGKPAPETGASVWAEVTPGFSGGCDESDCWLANLSRICFRPPGPAAIHPAANESRTATRIAAAILFQLRDWGGGELSEEARDEAIVRAATSEEAFACAPIRDAVPFGLSIRSATGFTARDSAIGQSGKSEAAAVISRSTFF